MKVRRTNIQPKGKGPGDIQRGQQTERLRAPERAAEVAGVDIDASRLERINRTGAKLIQASTGEGLDPASVAKTEYIRQGLMTLVPQLSAMAQEHGVPDLAPAIETQLNALSAGISQAELREYVDGSIAGLLANATEGARGEQISQQLQNLQMLSASLDTALYVVAEYHGVLRDMPDSQKPPGAEIDPQKQSGLENMADAVDQASDGIGESVGDVAQTFLGLANQHPELKPHFDELSGLIAQIEQGAAEGRDDTHLIGPCVAKLEDIMGRLPPDQADQVMQSVLAAGQAQQVGASPQAQGLVSFDDLTAQYKNHLKRVGEDFYFHMPDMKAQRKLLESVPAELNPEPRTVPKWAKTFMSLPPGRKRNAAILNMAMNQNGGAARELDKKELALLLHESIKSGDVFMLNDLAYITHVREEPIRLTAEAQSLLDQSPVFKEFVRYQMEVEGGD